MWPPCFHLPTDCGPATERSPAVQVRSCALRALLQKKGVTLSQPSYSRGPGRQTPEEDLAWMQLVQGVR